MSPSLRAADFQRILLIKPTAMGDVVHAIPTLVALRKRCPAAQIDWLITPENADLVRNHPALSGLVYFDRNAFRRRWWAFSGLLRLLRQLRAPRYDLVIDLHGQLRSGFFAVATGAPVRIGFDRPQPRSRPAPGEPVHAPSRGWAGAREGAWLAYTHRIPIRTLAVHAVDRYLWAGDLLGFPPEPVDQTLHLPPEAENRAGELLDRAGLHAGRFVVIAPSTVWETKHWRPEGFAEVARALTATGRGVVLVGGKGDRALCERIRSQCPEAVSLAGETSAGELAALIRRAALCLSNDSAAAHLAVALGTPGVAIYGPTNPVTVGPYRHPESVVRLDLPCSPCNYRRLRQCPNGHACMEQLPASLVVERIKSLLRE